MFFGTLFIVAGFIEGYVTRLTEMPYIFNLLIIGLSLAFIIFYFIIYPYQLTQRLNSVNAT